MNTGHIGLLDPHYALDVDDLDAQGQQTTEGGYDWVVRPGDVEEGAIEMDDGTRQHDFIRGDAAWTRVETVDSYTIDESMEIYEDDEEITRVEVGEWLLLPDAGLVVYSDDRVRWLLSRVLAGVDVVEASLNVSAWASDRDSAEMWGGGLSYRAVDTGVKKGSFYGDDVRADPDLGGDVADGPLTDVGVEYWFGHHPMKAYLAASGYVAAYADDWGAEEFAPWVAEEVTNYTIEPDNGEESEDESHADPDHASDDPDQTTLDDTSTDREVNIRDYDWDSEDPRECDQCGMDRTMTEEIDGEVWCITCAEDSSRGSGGGA